MLVGNGGHVAYAVDPGGNNEMKISSTFAALPHVQRTLKNSLALALVIIGASLFVAPGTASAVRECAIKVKASNQHSAAYVSVDSTGTSRFKKKRTGMWKKLKVALKVRSTGPATAQGKRIYSANISCGKTLVFELRVNCPIRRGKGKDRPARQFLRTYTRAIKDMPKVAGVPMMNFGDLGTWCFNK